MCWWLVSLSGGIAACAAPGTPQRRFSLTNARAMGGGFRDADRHQAIFGRAPDLAAGGRGVGPATNDQAATDRGVRRVEQLANGHVFAGT
jgi:hypothetical protein